MMALSAAAMASAGSATALSYRCRGVPSSSAAAAAAAAASLPLFSMTQLSRPGSFRVRCQAENSQEQTAPVAPAPKTSPTPPPPPPPPPKAPKVVSTKFSDVLAFSGPAPERINGRLAMVGFVAALGVELTRGDGLAAQLAGGDGLAWFLATASAVSVASLVPLFKGVTAESRSGGVMTSDAELWNGRFAMLGLVALAFTEYVKGGPLV